MSRSESPRELAQAKAHDDPVVAVDEVAVSFGNARILDGISLDVTAGEFVGLVGPNGAGKTTLLRTMRATLTPDTGSVRVAGDDVHSLSSRAASRLVASVPQESTLAFEFTVREAVEMGRTPHVSRFGGLTEVDHAAVEEAMDRTEIAEFADRPVTEVSGGERSRVLLARALAQQTPVLLLDEPTANLDVNHQIRTLDLVSELTDEGRTAVAAIHDLDLAARYCDRLVVVADGHVLADGTPEDVLSTDSLRAAFDAEAVVTRDAVTGSPTVTALSNRTDADGDSQGEPIETLDRIHVVAGGGRSGSLLTRLARAGLTVSVGPVTAGDSDAEVAAALGMETLTIDPLSGVDTATLNRLEGMVDSADAVVVGDVALSGGLVPVLRTVARAGVPVVCVTDRPLAKRAADESAVGAYRSLVQSGTAVKPSSVLSVLREIRRPADDQTGRCEGWTTTTRQ